MTASARNPKKPAPAAAGGRSGPVPTLADVARIVGVTKITVSRAINEPNRVSKDTLEKVRDAIRRTGYVPNLIAGSLSSNRSRLMVALVPTIGSSVFAETLQALSEAFQAAGFQLLLGQVGYGDDREDDLLDAVIGRRPDGIILTGVVHSAHAKQRLRAARIPVMETWELTRNPIDMLVGFSHQKIGAAAASYLIERGCRQLAVVTPDDRRARLRASAFQATAGRMLPAAAGKDIPVLEISSPTPMGTGRTALRELLDRNKKIDGIYCGTDTLALGLLIEARSRGLRVPDDLAVIGYGNLSFAKDTDPSLTTVSIDGAAIGRRAAEMLIARVKGEPVPHKSVDVGFEILRRESA